MLNFGVDRQADPHRRGTRADFQVLTDAGLDLKGKIAMANYGGVYRGTKVKNAQDNGMVGCIIFTDPLDDGEVTEENGYEAYPSTSHHPPPPHETKGADHFHQTDQREIPLQFSEAASASPLCIPVTRQPLVGPPLQTLPVEIPRFTIHLYPRSPLA